MIGAGGTAGASVTPGSGARSGGAKVATSAPATISFASEVRLLLLEGRSSRSATAATASRLVPKLRRDPGEAVAGGVHLAQLGEPLLRPEGGRGWRPRRREGQRLRGPAGQRRDGERSRQAGGGGYGHGNQPGPPSSKSLGIVPTA